MRTSHAARRMTALATLLAAMTLVPGVASAEVVLFADNFNRANDTNLNASATGKSGTLGALNWVEVATGAGNASVNTNRLLLESGATTTTQAIPYVDYNFIGLTTLTVSLDFVSAPVAGSIRELGFGIGNAKATLDARTSSAPIGDVSIAFDAATSLSPFATHIRIREQGVVEIDINQTLAVGSNVKGVFTFANMLNGTTLNYEVFFDNVSIYTGSTAWTGSDENYIAIFNTHRQVTADDSFVDNFSVSGTLVVIPAPAALPAGLAMLALAATRRRR